MQPPSYQMDRFVIRKGVIATQAPKPSCSGEKDKQRNSMIEKPAMSRTSMGKASSLPVPFAKKKKWLRQYFTVKNS